MLEDFRLKVFLAVASRGSFTLAAKELGISQPAVSQNVAELEKSLGAELFVRSRGNVTLTPAGKALSEYAEKIQYWYSAASALFPSPGEDGGRTRIRIAACRASADCVLPGAVARMLSARPALSFSILPLDAPDADCRVSLSVPGPQISLEESSSLLCQFRALALTSCPDERLMKESRSGLPQGFSLACWSGYSEKLPLELRSRVSLESDSVPMLLETASYSPSIIALVPLSRIPEGLRALPVELPGLAADLHFQPSAAFSGSGLCSLLRGILQDIR
ncbi:MAG: LysR family transcriptional regulator [Candidatus Cryptobacteroides sp.]